MSARVNASRGLGRPLCIGLSACIFHADPQRAIFKGKSLLYLEESMGQWLMSQGAVPLMLPRPSGQVAAPDLLRQVDGLVLQGGVDVAPQSYGEEPLQPEWGGDAVRDVYEIELLRVAMSLDRPVLGICRGAQVLNVGLGGSLFQDIQTQVVGAQQHRNWQVYDALYHDTVLVDGSYLSKLYGGAKHVMTNSVHHQAVKELGRDLVVQATAAADGVIEAVRYEGGDGAYALGVQWHPEFQRADAKHLLSPQPVLSDFLAAVRERALQRSGLHTEDGA